MGIQRVLSFTGRDQRFVLRKVFVNVLSCAVALVSPTAAQANEQATAVDLMDSAPVWGGHPVGFALFTHAPFQFVAFYDEHRRMLDPGKLRAIGQVRREEVPSPLAGVEGDFPGLKVQWADDSDGGNVTGTSFKLRWETLEANRDQPRAGTLPPPSLLRLVSYAAAKQSDKD